MSEDKKHLIFWTTLSFKTPQHQEGSNKKTKCCCWRGFPVFKLKQSPRLVYIEHFKFTVKWNICATPFLQSWKLLYRLSIWIVPDHITYTCTHNHSKGQPARYYYCNLTYRWVMNKNLKGVKQAVRNSLMTTKSSARDPTSSFRFCK